MKLPTITALTLSLLTAPTYAEDQTTATTPKESATPTTQSAPSTAKAPEEAKSTLNDKDKLSYTIGQNLGKSFKQQDIDLNMEIFTKGIQDAIADHKPLLSPKEMSEIMMGFQKERFAKQAAKRKEAGDKNLKEGQTFLEANKKKEGVITLPSGLQYKILKDGTGKTPTANDKVTTNYRGTLIDGTEFDSSYSRNQPASFPVKGVIKGWTEALQLMKEGAKWQLFVPANLAYGEQGVLGGKIGPNATLIFDIELISVEAGDKATSKLESPTHKKEVTIPAPKGEPQASDKSPTPAPTPTPKP